MVASNPVPTAQTWDLPSAQALATHTMKSTSSAGYAAFLTMWSNVLLTCGGESSLSRLEVNEERHTNQEIR